MDNFKSLAILLLLNKIQFSFYWKMDEGYGPRWWISINEGDSFGYFRHAVLSEDESLITLLDENYDNERHSFKWVMERISQLKNQSI